MNKTEKLISVILGLLLVGYLGWTWTRPAPKAAVAAKVADGASAGARTLRETATPPNTQAAVATPVPSASSPTQLGQPQPTLPTVPAVTNILENDELRLEFTSWGAAIQKATLLKYGTNAGAIGEGNPPLSFDFGASPLGLRTVADGASAGARTLRETANLEAYEPTLRETANLEAYEPTVRETANLAPNAAYAVKEATSNKIVYVCGPLTRTYTLKGDYQITLEETVADDAGALLSAPNTLSLGVLPMDGSRLGMISVDSWDPAADKGAVIHHDEGDSPLKDYLSNGYGGCACSGSGSGAAGRPVATTIPYPAPQKWIALKNRFFMTALVSSSQDPGFTATIRRDPHQAAYKPVSAAVTATFADGAKTRTSVLYVGPKKQSILSDLGMRDVMEFGMWRIICYPLVWILNAFYWLVPNYGIAIILLTILVRVVFWPLTHKSTVGMKKMQEIQPKMKEIQAKFKDNPQRMQQETWALYREAKVNPLSSCLPMLIQIPVFVALFNVLRTAVELRYAGFLWIADLSEPEALFASWFPFGGLNILPILMAVTTALQSWLTPSSGGDPSQRKMMTIMMPAMMLLMFYSFPAALSLYWFLSNLVSIVQMGLIRRQTAKEQKVVTPMEIIDPPQTRQMRRHQ